jgi:HD superfamily phosphohydrolase
VPHSVRTKLRAKAPDLVCEIDQLARQWLEPLLIKLKSPERREFRPKQINDPIWGTIELAPWEVALLDTPLLQRMRGVRQLGLAQLVFPSACHDRLEHILGVVGAVEQCVQSLSRQIERWNRDNQNTLLPEIEQKDRYAIRLAALLHDIGHGPFSHALEPVLETVSPLGDTIPTTSNWRSELRMLQSSLKEFYALNAIPSVSEVLAVMLVLSDAMAEVLANDKLILSSSSLKNLEI